MNLGNRLILITRPEPGGSETARQIACHQGRPLLAPLTAIQPIEDPAPLQNALLNPSDYDALLVTSANGARALVAALPHGLTPPPLLAVGEKSARELRACGWEVRVPEKAEGGGKLGESLLHWMPEARRVLFLRAEEGREELIRVLTGAGIAVDTVAVYRSVAVKSLPEEVLERLTELDAVLFFSPRGAEIFFGLLPEQTKLPKSCRIAALSPLTAATLTRLGVSVDIIPATPDGECLIQALHDYWERSANPSVA
ncbi:MAG: uroporphyrinogen-III synthase [Magnetococcus sp. YQC-9]